MFPTRSENFEGFIAAAKGFPQVWRIALGLIVFAIIYVGFVAGILGLGWLANGTDGLRYVSGGFSGQGSPVQTVIMLSSFLGLMLGIFVATRLLHKRPAMTLFGGDLGKTWRHFRFSVILIGIVFLAVTLIGFAIYSPVDNVPFNRWIVWLPLAIIFLFIQTTSEELIFRGYLQQQLAARFQSRWIWWVLPSAIFAALHYQPAMMGDNTWLVVAHTFLFGLIAADVTARTGNLGAAMGLHFANNVFALLLISVDGTLTGLSLFITPYASTDTSILQTLMLIDFAMILIGYLIYIRIMRRRDFL